MLQVTEFPNFIIWLNISFFCLPRGKVGCIWRFAHWQVVYLTHLYHARLSP